MDVGKGREHDCHGCRTAAWMQDDCMDAGGRATQGAVAEVEQRREQLPR
ncbi:MAG: hypothetical protein Q7U66_05640 [Methylobacter sp.]|nr:hypothetical protein [Methylobacter sp.]